MTLRNTVLGAALACLLLSGCGDSAAERMERAREDMAAGNAAAARVELIAALRGDPKNTALLALLGDALLRMGDGEGAAPVIERLGAIAPDAPETRRLRAGLALLSGNPGEVAQLLGDDADPEAWRLRALALWRLERREVAAAAFERGMAAGNDVRLCADHADFRMSQNDAAAAATILRRMQGFAPQAFETLMLDGRIALAAGDGKRAQAAFVRAAKQFPTRHEPLMAQALVLERQGRLSPALDLVAKAGELASGDSTIGAARLRLLARKGDWSKVRGLLQADEADLSPTSPEGLAYAEALLRLGHGEQARARLQRAVLMAPGDGTMRALLGEAQLATHDPEGALETLTPLARDPLVSPRALALAERAAREAGDPVAETWRARLGSVAYKEMAALSEAGAAAWGRGDWEAAAAIYRKLVGYGGSDIVLHRLAVASSRLGRHDDAIAFADRALADGGGASAADRHIAGWARLAAGRDLAKAAALLRLAVEGEPANAEFRADLAKAEAAAG